MRRILIADDEADLRRLVSFTLGNHGFEVIEVADGAAAIEAIRTERPDLVLLDVMMPERSGYDVLKDMKEDAATHGIPVIMLSAMSQTREVAEGLELGAVDYICKPFAPGDLVRRIEALFDEGDGGAL